MSQKDKNKERKAKERERVKNPKKEVTIDEITNHVSSDIEDMRKKRKKNDIIRRSRLTDAEKREAIRSKKAMAVNKLSFLISTIIISVLVEIIGMNTIMDMRGAEDVATQISMIMVIVCPIVAVAAVIIHNVIINRSDTPWNKYKTLIVNKWDGLSEEEIAKRMPNGEEQKEIKKRKYINIATCVLLVILYTFDGFIVHNMNISMSNPANILALVVILALWYFAYTGNQRVIYKLESGCDK